MKRSIIEIDRDTCTGCGLCIPGCPEGAIQVIDGKARLVSDLMCDGLGACLGECPEGAIRVIEREAEPYDERRVMENIVKQGENTIIAHLKHLRGHYQTEYLAQAEDYLREKGIAVSDLKPKVDVCEHPVACPGSHSRAFGPVAAAPADAVSPASALTHWPVQLHLIMPTAPHFQGSDLLLAADCTAYALGGFHNKYLKGKTLTIACPKLDRDQAVYLEKLKALIDEAKINTLTVLIMQVPCCRGLLQLAKTAVAEAKRKVPIKVVVVGIQGDILQEEWAA
jgi:NAD-dependent dihydropyrimidine dehydrogenase PreA subunit